MRGIIDESIVEELDEPERARGVRHGGRERFQSVRSDRAGIGSQIHPHTKAQPAAAKRRSC